MAWLVWRQDDNGQRFIVGTYSSREGAETRIAELTRSIHKQIYWISEVADAVKAER